MGGHLKMVHISKPENYVSGVTTMLKKIVLLFVSFFVMFFSISIPLEAQEENWQFTAELYLWYASMGGTATPGSDVDIGADDLIDALDMGFMGTLGVRKGKWSFMADVIYLDVGDDTDVAPGVNLDVGLKGWIVTPIVGYNVLDTDKAIIDVVAGARYFSLSSDVNITGIPEISDSGSVWDGIVGVRGEMNLTENWYIPFYGDIGTGESDLTWQLFAGIGYKFEKIDVIVAYRYLAWDFDDSPVFADLNINGPLAGIKIRF